MKFAAMAYDKHVKEAKPSLHRKAANFCLTCEGFRNPMQLSEDEIMRIAECPVQICGAKCSGRTPAQILPPGVGLNNSLGNATPSGAAAAAAVRRDHHNMASMQQRENEASRRRAQFTEE
jgi:hypothetical protein